DLRIQVSAKTARLKARREINSHFAVPPCGTGEARATSNTRRGMSVASVIDNRLCEDRLGPAVCPDTRERGAARAKLGIRDGVRRRASHLPAHRAPEPAPSSHGHTPRRRMEFKLLACTESVRRELHTCAPQKGEIRESRLKQGVGLM